jgi:hypothetical protein
MFKKLFGLFNSKILLVIFVTGLSMTAQAKIFRNAYVSFELPESWKCVLEHTEWVCRSIDTVPSKEAIIILTAKEVGPTDSFSLYTSYLEKPLSNGAKTAGIPSKIIYAPKQIVYNDHPWIDALHLSSEVPNYFTRYLATIKEKIAVLVTFSAHKDHYTKYSNDFFKAVQSLRVIAAKNLLAQPESLRPGSDLLGSGISKAMPGDMEGSDIIAPPSNGRSSKTKAILFLFAILLTAGALFALLRLKKRK